MKSTDSSRFSAAISRRLPPRPAALAVVVAVLCAPLAGGAAAVAALRYERAALATEPWRLLTAHLVHFDAAHLAMNLAGLLLLWWLFVRDATPRHWAVVALVSALTVGAGLWFLEPSVAWYVGASGVLHGAWAAAGVAARRRRRLESTVTLALLAAKLALEQWRGPVSSGLDPQLPVIVGAHLYGALGGLAAALALRLGRQPL